MRDSRGSEKGIRDGRLVRDRRGLARITGVGVDRGPGDKRLRDMAKSAPSKTNIGAFLHALHTRIALLGGLRHASRVWQYSPGTISDVLHGKRPPGPALIRAIGWERVIWYRKRGAYVADAVLDVDGHPITVRRDRGESPETEEQPV